MTFENKVILNIKTKNIDRLLSKVYKLNIDIINIKILNYKELNIEIYEKDLKKIKRINILNNIKIVRYEGIKTVKNFIKKNITMILSLMIGLLFLLFLSNLILSIEINHNNYNFRKLIREQLKIYGIDKYRLKKNYKELENIKQKILDNNKDKIEWMEIIENGITYIVNVEERKIKNNVIAENAQDIISTHDAIIKKVIANKGTIIKEVNDYVKKGDTLISGSIYLNEELKDIVRADGKVYGEVWFNSKLKYPIIDYSFKKTYDNKFNISLNIFNSSIGYKKGDKHIENTKIILKNNILPINLSKNILFRLDNNGINTEGLALLNARNYSLEKIKKTLDEDEYIISDKILKYNVKCNTIYIDIFYKVYKNITGYKELERSEYHD